VNLISIALASAISFRDGILAPIFDTHCRVGIALRRRRIHTALARHPSYIGATSALARPAATGNEVARRIRLNTCRFPL
jgi:hypothetical protein